MRQIILLTNNNAVKITIKMKPVEVMGDYHIKSNGIAFNKDSMELHLN